MAWYLTSVQVNGFDPNHELWGAFVEKAVELERADLPWSLAFPGSRPGSVRLRAFVAPPTSESAVSQLRETVITAGMRAVHEAPSAAGVDWEHGAGEATEYNGTPAELAQKGET